MSTNKMVPIKILVIALVIVGTGGGAGIGIMSMNNIALANNTSELQNQLNAFSVLYDGLSARYDSLLSNYSNLMETLSVLSGEYDTLNITYNALYQTYVESEVCYESLMSNYTQLENDYASLMFLYSSLTELYNNLEASYDSLLFEYTALETSYNNLLSQYLLLNTTYWELWNSTQPDYEVIVVGYTVPYHTMLCNISVGVIVTLEYVNNGLPVEDGIVIINGYLCSYLGAGMWNTTIMQPTISSLVLDNVVYINSTGSVVDVDQNGKLCVLSWVDVLYGYSRNPVVSTIVHNDAYGGHIKIEFTNEREYHLYGENTTLSWNVTELIVPEYVLVYIDGNPNVFYDLRYVWEQQDFFGGYQYNIYDGYWDGMSWWPVWREIFGDDYLINLFDNWTTEFYFYDCYPSYTGYSTFRFSHELAISFEYFDGIQWIPLYTVSTQRLAYDYIHFGDGGTS